MWRDRRPNLTPLPSVANHAVAKSASDGYTLLVSFSSHTINATLYPKLPFDPVTDFMPISMIATVPSLLVGNPALQNAPGSLVSSYCRLREPIQNELVPGPRGACVRWCRPANDCPPHQNLGP